MAYEGQNYVRAAMIAVANDNGVGVRFGGDDGDYRIEIDTTTSPQQVAMAMHIGIKPFLSLMVMDVHTQCGIALTPLVATLRKNGSKLPDTNVVLPGLRKLEAIRCLSVVESAVQRTWSRGPAHDSAGALLYYTALLAHLYASPRLKVKQGDLSRAVARQMTRVLQVVDALLTSEPTNGGIERLAVMLDRGPATTLDDIQSWTVDIPAHGSLRMLDWPWLEKCLALSGPLLKSSELDFAQN
jgi:hypothetical protein